MRLGDHALMYLFIAAESFRVEFESLLNRDASRSVLGP